MYEKNPSEYLAQRGNRRVTKVAGVEVIISEALYLSYD